MDAALETLCVAAGQRAGEALALLSKILRNVEEQPAEAKFRRLNPESAKLKGALLCHPGAVEALILAGFTCGADGTLELPAGEEAACATARAAVRRREIRQAAAEAVAKLAAPASQESRLSVAYRAVVEGGAHGLGHSELEAVLQHEGGHEALQLLERIITNIRRYPDSEKYRCVNLAKAGGKKAAPAVPLLRVAGFEQTTSPEGEECMLLARPNVDVLERVWAMVYWATRPDLPALPKPSNEVMSRALGLVIGAVVGDALGAPLGGRGPFEVTAAEVDKAMEMCGGGLWCVAPGQCTSASELLVCLAEALASVSEVTRGGAMPDLPADDLALRYGTWGRSHPFRAERASSLAFQRPLSADSLRERAKEQNSRSKGSGALLRCPPLAALGALRRAAPAAAAALARADAQLSHPEAAVGEASAAFVFIAHHLVTSGDCALALEELRRWAEAERSARAAGVSAAVGAGGPSGSTHLSRGVQERVGERAEEKAWAPPGEQLAAADELLGWIRRAVGSEELAFSSMETNALLTSEVGSVEIPLTHALRHVRLGSDFATAMRIVLAGGGDSCSTAGAVGALVGAAVGLEGIPERWVRAVLGCDTSAGQARPPEYQPCQLPSILERFRA